MHLHGLPALMSTADPQSPRHDYETSAGLRLLYRARIPSPDPALLPRSLKDLTALHEAEENLVATKKISLPPGFVRTVRMRPPRSEAS